MISLSWFPVDYSVKPEYDKYTERLVPEGYPHVSADNPNLYVQDYAVVSLAEDEIENILERVKEEKLGSVRIPLYISNEIKYQLKMVVFRFILYYENFNISRVKRRRT